MKKNLSLLVLALLSLIPCGARAEMATQLIVTLSDNSTQTFLLSEKPKVTFGTTDLTITSSAATYTAERTDVQSFTFKEIDVEGIQQTETLTGTGISRLYNLAGQMLQEGTLNLQNLPAGNYVIKTEGQKAIKVTKN